MTLKELKHQYFNTLDSIYPKEEIESFYFLLIEEILNLKRIDVALNPQKEIPEEVLLKLNYALKKLQQEIPIQYIIGATEFFELPFKVDESVLIPRPETEELVLWILSETKDKKQKTKDLNIIDLGTGSGCIAIALAKNLPEAKVYALDVSEKALGIAKQNATLNEVNIEFIQQDILDSSELFYSAQCTKNILQKEHESNLVVERSRSKFDIIVSNPPYVRELEKEEINNNVLNNEPHLALFVDDHNPLLFYNKIADLAKKHLNPNGYLFFEINQYLGKETVELLKNKGFKNIELRKDIFGNDRMIRVKY